MPDNIFRFISQLIKAILMAKSRCFPVNRVILNKVRKNKLSLTQEVRKTVQNEPNQNGSGNGQGSADDMTVYEPAFTSDDENADFIGWWKSGGEEEEEGFTPELPLEIDTSDDPPANN